MKVLWFTNSPSSGESFLKENTIGRGWIGALEAQLIKIPSVELAISFPLDYQMESFTINSTSYFPIHIPDKKNKVEKIINRWKKPLQDESQIQLYLQVIDKFKPDVIHIFGTEDAFGLMIPNTSVPCVIHLQGNLTICDHMWYSGLTALDVIKYSRKWPLIKGFGLFHNYWMNKKEAKRERQIFKAAKFFMGRTDWDRRVTSVLSPHSQYFHCDEMIRPQFYCNEWLPKKNDNTLNLISVIRKNIYKGIETIFECKRLLNELNLNRKISWKIAGINCNDEISLLVEKKYKSTFRDNEINLMGSLSEKELIIELLGADIFIHPSHIDNSPNCVCEAMLVGMPIISTFAGGIPSIIENKKEGLLVQDGDPFALAGCIKELTENNNLAIELAKNARLKAVERHSPDKILKDLLNIYSSLQ